MFRLKHLLLFFILAVGIKPALAQINNDYQIAIRLMQQQRYSDALPLFESMVEENPQSFLYFDKLIECHIHLKQYDEGLSLAQQQIKKNRNVAFTNILIGELYHIKGDTAKAFSTWETNLLDHPDQLQIYISTARIMRERKAFLKTIDVYKQARIKFKNSKLFASDVASAYMEAGEYELAIQEWLNMIETNTNQLNYIQKLLVTYNDPLLYDIMIVELDDRTSAISTDNPQYKTLLEFQIWLLLENKLYRRALVTARNYENKTSNFNYSLFNVGRQLVDNNEFDLATGAFNYYIEHAEGEVKWLNTDELARTYFKWAQFIEDFSLEDLEKKNSLLNTADSLLNAITSNTKSYSKIKRVYIMQAELALDYLFNTDKAEQALQKLQGLPDMTNSAEASYIEGRLHLANKDYALARVAFTKANKKANIGELAEKTRYFLALTDFYSGDYEFANIQLKTMGRQNTSYYANDAMKLRLWLQKGLAADSTGAPLDAFAQGLFKNSIGQTKESLNVFLSILQNDGSHPLYDDILVLISQGPNLDKNTYFSLLDNYLVQKNSSPLKERLLWECAKLAEQLNSPLNKIDMNENPVNPAELYYEELILDFPQGFYAPYARQRLTELAKKNS